VPRAHSGNKDQIMPSLLALHDVRSISSIRSSEQKRFEYKRKKNIENVNLVNMVPGILGGMAGPNTSVSCIAASIQSNMQMGIKKIKDASILQKEIYRGEQVTRFGFEVA
jgi:hypothetical protein